MPLTPPQPIEGHVRIITGKFGQNPASRLGKDVILKGAQWLSGRVLDSRPWGFRFESHLGHCVVSLSKNINPSLVLVKPRKTRPFITERLLMGRKESNQTNKCYFEAIVNNTWPTTLCIMCSGELKIKSPRTGVHVIRPQDKTVFSYFSTKTYVVGAQKNRLDEVVLLCTQNKCFKVVDKKY